MSNRLTISLLRLLFICTNHIMTLRQHKAANHHLVLLIMIVYHYAQSTTFKMFMFMIAHYIRMYMYTQQNRKWFCHDCSSNSTTNSSLVLTIRYFHRIYSTIPFCPVRDCCFCAINVDCVCSSNIDQPSALIMIVSPLHSYINPQPSALMTSLHRSHVSINILQF